MSCWHSLFLARKTDRSVCFLAFALPAFPLIAQTWVDLNNAGAQAFAAGNMVLAEREYSKALDLAPPLAREGRARIHSNLAAVFKRRGEFDRAATHYRLALSHRTAGGADYAVTLNNLGEMLRNAGNTRQAITIFRDAVRMLETCVSDCRLALAAARNNLGVALGEIGRYTEGRRQLEASLRTKRQLFPGDHAEVVLTRRNIQKLLSDVRVRRGERPWVVDAMEFR